MIAMYISNSETTSKKEFGLPKPLHLKSKLALVTQPNTIDCPRAHVALSMYGIKRALEIDYFNININSKKPPFYRVDH
jgi:hypothetical protein